MQRNDHRIRRGAGGRNQGKKLRCRNRTHFGIFRLTAALNKAKGESRCPAHTYFRGDRSGLNALPDINRMPLLFELRLFHYAVPAFQSKTVGRHLWLPGCAHIYNFAELRFAERHH